ncbi:MAG TPA: sulfite exporter TauE/SafE family protein [Fimbriimonas sp.]|nr:sulfite exporter TauE/SafE family protein [Fimbriimonas sp.]
MTILEAIAYFCLFLTGISFGLIGAGGAILIIPILVYMLGQPGDLAPQMALPISVLTSGVGASIAYRQGLVDLKRALEFGIPTAITSYLAVTYVVPAIPEVIIGLPRKSGLMVIFSFVLVAAGVAMIRPKKGVEHKDKHPLLGLLAGVLIGLMAGVFGIGGGFMIVPVLAMMFGMEMKKAVGTALASVFLITSSATVGVIQKHPNMPWGFLLGVIGCAVVGMVGGSSLRSKIDGNKLKTGFGYFIVAVAAFVLFMELIVKAQA